MYFIAPSGRPVDVMVDRLVMCHTLDFRPSFRNSSLTLDPADLLLSKLQIFELNAKDAHDITHLLAGVPVGDSASGRADGGAFIDTGRFGEVLGADWGWWRTTTGNLEKLPALLAESPEMVPQTAALRPARAGGTAARRGQVGAQGDEVEAAGQRRRPGALVRAARRGSALTESGIR